jgi:cobalamin biosynthesis protein CobT
MQSGRIHAKNLWRTRANDDHIFKQKVENLTLKDTAVTLLVDFSGSMGGDKIQHATAACLMLNQAITRLGVKTNITGFSDTFQPVEFRIKGWSERLTDDQIVDRFSRASNLMCQNADGESLMFAYHDLMQRPEKKKLLIVLSDGSPCSYGDGDDDELLYNVAKQIEGDKRVSLYGIGIQDRNVQRYYTQRTTISEAHELEDKLLDVVQKQILGS